MCHTPAERGSGNSALCMKAKPHRAVEQEVMRIIALAIACLLSPLLLVVAHADTHAGWHDLTTLKSWVDGAGKPVAPGKWVVTDKVLHLTGKGGGSLYSAKQYADFELMFDWKIAPKGNSGLKYRMAKYEGKGMLGLEYQVYDDGDKPFSKGSTASLYDIIAPDEKTKKTNKVGEWNRTRIVVRGGHFQHFLNGKKVVDITVGSPEWKAALAQSKFKNAKGFAENPKGPLMLQDHGSEVWYREIKIKEL